MVKWQYYEESSTIELIELIKMKSNKMQIEVSKAAFNTFVFRFTEELTKKTEIICSHWGYNSEIALEVSKKTFQRFWKYPNFCKEKCKTNDIDKGVLLYLFQIARNVLADLVNELNGIVSPYDGNEEIIWDFPNRTDVIFTDYQDAQSHFAIVKEALSTLSIKHKIIYLTYSANEYSGYKLPRKLLQELREKLKISQQTVRSYKNEAYNKVKEYLSIYEKK